MASPTSFADATAIKQLTSHTYSAFFPDDWCIGAVPHGGFVTAAFLQVARAHFNSTLSSQNQPHTITLHLDFLRRTQVGEAIFTIKDTKLGRQASVIHISLSQGTLWNVREEVVGYITNSNMDSESGVTFSTGYKLTPPPLPVNLPLLKQDKDKNWARQGDMPFASFRKATTRTQFHFPRQRYPRDSMQDEWVRLSNGEKWTSASLGYIADMWPMPAEILAVKNAQDVQGKPGALIKPPKFWYPTMLLNLDIKKALPDEGVEWLFARVDTKQIKNGRMDIEVVILDESGDIVAISQHVALVVGVERNVANRTIGGSRI